MADYPLVVRNNVALYLRGFMLAFLFGVVLITWACLRDGPPDPNRWWPLILATFWLAGLYGLAHALDKEVSVVRAVGRGQLVVKRGKAFRRTEQSVSRARFWIVDTEDSDGNAYFKLMMDAPGGDLTVKEGHQRAVLEVLQRRLESALA